MPEQLPSDMGAQQQLRSACAFVQSDQNLHSLRIGQPRLESFFLQTTKTDQIVQMYRLTCVFLLLASQKVSCVLTFQDHK